MYKDVSCLIFFEDTKKELEGIAGLTKFIKNKDVTPEELMVHLSTQLNIILKKCTQYGLFGNLWHNYLTLLLIHDENPFSCRCERRKINIKYDAFIDNDIKIFIKLFNYDFSEIEKAIGRDLLSSLFDYKFFKASEYNDKNTEKLCKLSKDLSQAKNEKAFFDILISFYKENGVGIFALNKAFRMHNTGGADLIPIKSISEIRFDDLIGYKAQKELLIENTKALLNDKPANNVLLYGDSGTGKSSAIKAIINEYYNEGLRLIEINKFNFKTIPDLLSLIKQRNYKFIIYIDDLSFEEFETEYKLLKAVIEGGIENKPENVLIYATSNRRHLIKETWKDRNDTEYENGIHRSDTIEEKMSLFNRFGITINFGRPSMDEYYEIIYALSKKKGIDIPEEELKKEASKWELRHGNISGRTARQFVDWILSKKDKE